MKTGLFQIKLGIHGLIIEIISTFTVKISCKSLKVLLKALLEVYQANFCSIASMMGQNKTCYQIFLKCLKDGFSLQAHVTDDWLVTNQQPRKKPSNQSRRFGFLQIRLYLGRGLFGSVSVMID